MAAFRLWRSLIVHGEPAPVPVHHRRPRWALCTPHGRPPQVAWRAAGHGLPFPIHFCFWVCQALPCQSEACSTLHGATCYACIGLSIPPPRHPWQPRPAVPHAPAPRPARRKTCRKILTQHNERRRKRNAERDDSFGGHRASPTVSTSTGRSGASSPGWASGAKAAAGGYTNAVQIKQEPTAGPAAGPAGPPSGPLSWAEDFLGSIGLKSAFGSAAHQALPAAGDGGGLDKAGLLAPVPAPAGFAGAEALAPQSLFDFSTPYKGGAGAGGVLLGPPGGGRLSRMGGGGQGAGGGWGDAGSACIETRMGLEAGPSFSSGTMAEELASDAELQAVLHWGAKQVRRKATRPGGEAAPAHATCTGEIGER